MDDQPSPLSPLSSSSTSSTPSLPSPPSQPPLEQLQSILQDPHQFQMFLNHLSPSHTDADLLFIVQIDQLVPLSLSNTRQVLEDQYKRIYSKHLCVEPKADMYLSLLPEESMDMLRKAVEEGTVLLEDFVTARDVIGREIEREYIPSFMDSGSGDGNRRSISVVDSTSGYKYNYIPSLERVVESGDREVLQMFVLYLMRDCRHRMFLFWLEMERCVCLFDKFGNDCESVTVTVTGNDNDNDIHMTGDQMTGSNDMTMTNTIDDMTISDTNDNSDMTINDVDIDMTETMEETSDGLNINKLTIGMDMDNGNDVTTNTNTRVYTALEQLQRIENKYVLKDRDKDIGIGIGIDIDIDSTTTSNPSLSSLRHSLLEKHKKIGRILRLELWPEFCRCQLFNSLLESRSSTTTSTSTSTSTNSTKRQRRYSVVSLFKTQITDPSLILTVPKPRDAFSPRNTNTNGISNSNGNLLPDFIVVFQANNRNTQLLPKETPKDNKLSAERIFRFPQTDSSEFSLPPHLELFCFPQESPSNTNSNTDTSTSTKKPRPPSPPRIFSFITTSDNQSIYCTCMHIPSSNGTGTLAVCLVAKNPLIQTCRDLLLPLAEASSPLLESNAFKTLQSFVSETKKAQISDFSEETPKSPKETEIANKMQTPLIESKTNLTLPLYRSVPPLSLSPTDFPLTSLFKLLHPYKLLSILEYLYLEKKVLLVSSQLSLLTLAGETLRTLLFPLTFQFLYTPMLPSALLSALQCPTPFLIGIHSSMKSQALNLDQIHQDLYIVDLDYDSVSPPRIVQFSLPPIIRTQLLKYFRRVAVGGLSELDYYGLRESSLGERWGRHSNFEKGNTEMNTLRRALVHSWLGDMLEGVQNFVVVVPDFDEFGVSGKPPLLIFDSAAYLREKGEEYQRFLKAFFKTSAFSSFLCSLASGRGVLRLSILGDY